jgi:TRAP-type C4-dicarboxylate transport system substrate-binding protein
MTHRALAALAALGFAASAEAAELRMISGFPEGFVFTREIAEPFMAEVAQATDGAVTVSLAGPDVVPTFEQVEPVQAGVFDLLFTHPAYHAGITGLGLVIDAIDADPAARRETGIIDTLDAHYAQLGLKLLAAPPTGSDGFHYVMKAPIDGEPAFDGLKIRGTVSYNPMIEALGGAPVVLGDGEVYTALQTGVVDGAAWGLTGVKDFKWHEVAGYMTRPVFGQVGVMILMNLDAFEGLPADQQAALLEVGRAIEAASVARFDALAAEEFAALKDLGMAETRFSDAEAATLDALWADGVWQVAIGAAGADAEALRAQAREAGLTP